MRTSKFLPAYSYLGIIIAASCLHAEEKPAIADIKPAIDQAEIDEEQMRITKIIHKRIVDYAAIKEKTNGGQKENFAAYKDTLQSGAQFDMAAVSGGSFAWKGKDEGDSLQVTISPFWIGTKEVTWEEYDPFMYGVLPREKDGQLPDFMREEFADQIDAITRPTKPYHPMTFGMPRDGHPAVGMTQHAANKYCQWISFQTGHFYRLPTEAEWEYACRAGKETAYSWDEGSNPADYAWFGGDAASHYKKPGTKKPNPWGIYDMHGNVLEWTLDQSVPNRRQFFGKDQVKDPWVRPTEPYPMVTKGGHWKMKLEELTSSASVLSEPIWKEEDPQEPKSIWYYTKTPWLGMRVVRPQTIPTVEEMYRYWNSGVKAFQYRAKVK